MSKAPDKIYIVKTEAARGTVLLACGEYNDFCKNHETQEYIRKDTLLKWIHTELDAIKGKEEMSQMELAFTEVIDKIQRIMTPIEKLKAEIERLLKCTEPHRGEAVADGSRQTLYWIKDFITSLQQEQPLLEVKETIVETGGIKGILEEIPSNVDLEKAIEGATDDYAEGRRLEQRILEESRRFPEVSFAKLSRIAKHFYDFGKQERFVEPQRLEEAAEEIANKHGFVKHPSCKPAKYSYQAVRDVFIEAAIAGAKWMFEKAPSEQAIAYVKAFHSASEVSEFQAAMNIAAAKAFDAGARWMAEQGVTIEGFITGCDDHISFDSEDYLPKGSPFEDMEHVIVQIRKKEE